MATTKTSAQRKTKPRARKVATKAAPKRTFPVVDLSEPLETPAKPDYNSPEWAAQVQAYATLQEAGVSIPPAIALPVEAWLRVEAERGAEERAAASEAEEAEAAQIAEEDKEGPFWIRNLTGAPFNLRLQRQDKKQRIELKPRGQRGDMFPLSPGDENDHILRANLGFFEVIGDASARKISEGQTRNIQKTNTTLALIRNENDKPINKLTVETEYNKQGVVVGYIDPNAKPKAPLGGIIRPNQVQPEQVSHFVPTGGNPAIISQGYMNENAKAAVADKLARIKGRQGRPEDVLGLTVSVEPTRSV